MKYLEIILVCYSSRGHQYVFGYPTNPSYKSAATLSSPKTAPINLINSLNYSENNFQVQSDSYTSTISEHYGSQQHNLSQSYQHFLSQQMSGSYKRANDMNLKIKSSKEKIRNSYKTDNSIIMNKKELNRELNLKPNLVNKMKESNINSNKSQFVNSNNNNSNSKHNTINEINNSQNNSNNPNNNKVQSNKLKKTNSNHSAHTSMMNEGRNNNNSNNNHHNQQEKFLGYDTQFLADILSPKSALCDQKFQLTINNLTFVGHPTLINSDSTSNKNSMLNRYLKKRIENNKNNENINTNTNANANNNNNNNNDNNNNNSSNNNVNQYNNNSKTDKINNNRYAHLSKFYYKNKSCIYIIIISFYLLINYFI